MNIKNLLIAVLTGALLVAGTYLFLQSPAVQAQTGTNQRTTTSATTTNATTTGGNATVTIQPASDVVKAVSASGNIALVSQVDVADPVGGTVNGINIQAGDVVTAGQVLLTLDTADLQRAVTLAQIAVQTDKNQIALLNVPPTAENLATAQANLASAQANLANVKAGPTAAQLAAAQSALAAAQANYATVTAPADQDQLDQLKANLETARIAQDDARRTYEKTAWLNLPGTTPELAAYQQAQVTYKAAQAAYDQAQQPPASDTVQSARSTVQNAKESLAALTPTDAALAAAQAQVVSAQSALDTLTQGPDALALKAAQLTLKEDLINLEQALTNLAQAQIVAPVGGTILAINTTVGQQIGAGTVVAALADTSQLQLTINVAEVDIPRLQTGKAAQVAIDAFPGQNFQGKVSLITPVSSSTSGIINYPVTIHLTGDNLAAVRPGMTAVATLATADTATADEWFVPTNALQQQGAETTVNVMRNGAPMPVTVTTTGTVQSDWTLVKAADLHAGDQVIGSVTTKISNNQSPFGAGRGPGGFGGGPGGRQNRPAP